MDADLDADVPAARWGGHAVAAMRQTARAMLDLVLPPQCLACDRLVAVHGSLCPTCWSRLTLIERPYCARLGVPFAHFTGDGVLSAEALADPPPFDRCRAVAAFDDVARRLVHGLKYRDRLDLATWMGGWMVRAGADVVPVADLVIPVPLHVRRLWYRRANQAALLAQAIARQAGRPFAPTVLRRVRPTEQQVGLTADQRNRNVRGAFGVADRAAATVRGRRVLLVDDVYTTGATVKAATRTLLKAGAVAVDVLVFARVVRSGG